MNMDYLELAPIVECESADSESEDEYELKSPTVEEFPEIPELPLPVLLKQESIKSRFEFSRQENQSKPKQPAIDTFPNIRGLEYEIPKFSQNESNLKTGKRSSIILKSTSIDALKIENFNTERQLSGKFNDDDAKSFNSDTSENFISRNITKRLKTFNSNETIEYLKNLINNKNMPAELMLMNAIGSVNDFELNGKKKENYFMDIAMSQLDYLAAKHSQSLTANQEILEDIEKLEKFSEQTQTEGLEIEESIKDSTKSYSESRSSLEARLKSTHHKIYLALNNQEKLQHTLKDTKEKYTKLQSETLAVEETYQMQNEDLRTQLTVINKKRIKAELESNKLSDVLVRISEQKLKKKLLKSKIKICTKSLRAVGGYINDARAGSNFTQEFVGLLSDIKSEILETIKLGQQSKAYATTDPKLIMPYHRASNLYYR
jgi:hypothetical protein